MRRLLFGGIVFLLAILIVVFYLLISRSNSTPSSNIPPSTDTNENPPTTQETFVIETTEGSVLIKNFYKNPVAILPGIGLVLTTTFDYDIHFMFSDNSFTITIFNPPIVEVRRQAEEELLNILGVSEQDACKLNVHLGVHRSADSDLGGGADYGLSFCSSGLPFPEL
jgi:hypothetical protein